MTTEVIPLGTGAALPTRDRHLSATMLKHQGSLLLFDCGEGTQRRIVESGVKRSRLDAILITHLHGDHFYGLPGLLSTLALLQYTQPLTIIGPAGLQTFVECTSNISGMTLPFPLIYVSLSEKDFEAGSDPIGVFEHPNYTVVAAPLAHRVFTVGYRFQGKERPGNLDIVRATALGITEHEQFRALKAGLPVTIGNRVIQPEEVVGPPHPGATFAYCFDTRPCAGTRQLADHADLLYHDATFDHSMHQKAIQTGHATAREAAEIARDAGAKRLLLGHFSARYHEPDVLVAEARKIFENTEPAVELKRYILTS